VTGSISWFEAVVLGVVQGLTEFLPISSSAHIFVVAQLFGWSDPGAAFTAVSQIGTELAVLIYFRKDLIRIVSSWWSATRRGIKPTDIDGRMGWYIILGTIPIAVIGFLFAHQIETAARNLWLVAGTLIVFGVILGLADRFGQKIKSLSDLRIRDGLLFGLGQALALIPGVSRSGATITTGLALGYSREAATRYSFLLAIPAVLGSGFYEATKIGQENNVSWGPTILATVIAFGIGYAVIAWLLRWVSTHSFAPFVAYRIVLGLILALLLATGVLSATG
jgi:undecaprenyl-diphosphatase